MPVVSKTPSRMRPFQCSTCDSTFRDRAGLRLHCQRQHKRRLFPTEAHPVWRQPWKKDEGTVATGSDTIMADELKNLADKVDEAGKKAMEARDKEFEYVCSDVAQITPKFCPCCGFNLQKVTQAYIDTPTS